MFPTIFFHRTNTILGYLAGILIVLAGESDAQELAQPSSPKWQEVFLGVSNMRGKLGVEIYVNFVPMGFPPALLQIKPGDLITLLNPYYHNERRFGGGRQFHYFYCGEDFLWIDFNGEEYMVNDVLRGVCSYSPGLRHQDQYLSHIRYLEWYGKMTTANATLLSKRCPELNICYFSPDLPSKPLKHLPHITFFDLGGYRSRRDNLYQLRQFPNIEILNLWRAEDVDDECMKILKDFRNLRALNLSGTKVTDAGLRHLQGLQSLQILSMEDTEITDQGLEYIGKLQNLKTLNLLTRGIRGPGLAYLKNLKQLETLKFRNLECQEDLRYLRDLENLGALYLDSNEGDLAYLKGLKNLQVFATCIIETDLEYLKDFKDIPFLRLNCAELTDAGLAQLKTMPNLYALDLGACKITDAGLAHLANLTNLRELGLTGINMNITDKGMVHLKNLSNLQILNLHGSPLPWSQRQITDMGMAYLANLNQLRALDLAYAQITDTGLAHLSGLHNLCQLNLCKTKITDSGLEHLAQLHELRILWLRETKVGEALEEYRKEHKNLKEW